MNNNMWYWQTKTTLTPHPMFVSKRYYLYIIHKRGVEKNKSHPKPLWPGIEKRSANFFFDYKREALESRTRPWCLRY